MKILIVNTYSQGGAANACIRLHEGLLNIGVDSKLLFRVKLKNVPQSYSFEETQIPYKGWQKKWFKWKYLLKELIPYSLRKHIFSDEHYLKTRHSSLEHFSFPSSNYDITRSTLYREADIINLHWVAEFLNFDTFFKINTKPVIWTLHDMNPFSGGEHYVESRIGLDSEGNYISRKISSLEKDLFQSIISLKVKALENIEGLNIVAPSQWLCAEARESKVFRDFPVHNIPYGLDSNTFRLYDQQVARDILQIETDKPIILFVSDKIDSERKGIKYLIQALERIDPDRCILCVVGATNGLNFENVKCELHLLGHVKDERIMSLCYNAADLFIIPSLMDNLPNTVLESLMCGTPVVGFRIGGIPDMVIDGQNGQLVDELSPVALANTISHVLNNLKKFDRDTISSNAISKYSLNIQAENYLELFEEILNKNTN